MPGGVKPSMPPRRTRWHRFTFAQPSRQCVSGDGAMGSGPARHPHQDRAAGRAWSLRAARPSRPHGAAGARGAGLRGRPARPPPRPCSRGRPPAARGAASCGTTARSGGAPWPAAAGPCGTGPSSTSVVPIGWPDSSTASTRVNVAQRRLRTRCTPRGPGRGRHAGERRHVDQVAPTVVACMLLIASRHRTMGDRTFTRTVRSRVRRLGVCEVARLDDAGVVDQHGDRADGSPRHLTPQPRDVTRGSFEVGPERHAAGQRRDLCQARPLVPRHDARAFAPAAAKEVASSRPMPAGAPGDQHAWRPAAPCRPLVAGACSWSRDRVNSPPRRDGVSWWRGCGHRGHVGTGLRTRWHRLTLRVAASTCASRPEFEATRLSRCRTPRRPQDRRRR